MGQTKVQYATIGKLIGKDRRYVWGAVNGKFTPSLKWARRIVKASGGTVRIVDLLPELKALLRETLGQ